MFLLLRRGKDRTSPMLLLNALYKDSSLPFLSILLLLEVTNGNGECFELLSIKC